MDQPNLWQRFLDLFRASEGDSSTTTLRLVVFGVAGLLALLVLLWLLRRFFGRRRRPETDWDQALRIDLDACPLVAIPLHGPRLLIYHVPVQLRLVVLAPTGKDGDLDATAIEKYLDRVVPGLGNLTLHQRPLIRVWPAQVSHHGFIAAFHRRTTKAARRGEPSRWVLVAGRAQLGRQTLMIGLGLWAEQPNTIDRVNLEPHQWLDVLRLKQAEG